MAEVVAAGEEAAGEHLAGQDGEDDLFGIGPGGVDRVTPVPYAEIVASIATNSAGPGTRANIDEHR